MVITTVLDLLESISNRFPAKAAFTSKEETITFSEIKSIVDSVGTALAELIPQGSAVICMTGRHVKTPAYFLSIVRAGSFYAPVDATVPKERLLQMIDVAQADYLLVDQDNLEAAKALGFKGKLFVAEELEETTPDPVLLKSIKHNMSENDPLYMIFTSGSTGKPKGVLTSHLSLICYIDAVREVLNITDEDIFGGQSPLDYIAAIRDIYLPLMTGASTVIIPKEEFAMPKELFATLNRNQVTALCWSAAGLEVPVKLGALSDIKPKYVRKICFSGSVLPGFCLKAWQEALPEALFVNQYGPTETTASCTYYVVNEKATDETILPIGKAYKHYRVFLLNENGHKVPDGEMGEICVGGPCIALGYYNAPEKTAECFIQNPLNKSFRDIIYKTGDLGVIRKDGMLEFHGRKDRQIKHMGHRIELEEIEGKALTITGINECAALYHQKKELLYLFYSGEATRKEIVLNFRNTMPAFMVPRKVISIDALPKLPNGKRDMNALQSMMD